MWADAGRAVLDGSEGCEGAIEKVDQRLVDAVLFADVRKGALQGAVLGGDGAGEDGVEGKDIMFGTLECKKLLHILWRHYAGAFAFDGDIGCADGFDVVFEVGAGEEVDWVA